MDSSFDIDMANSVTDNRKKIIFSFLVLTTTMLNFDTGVFPPILEFIKQEVKIDSN